MCNLTATDNLFVTSDSDYVSLNLTNTWLDLFGNPTPASGGYLLITQTDGLNNGRFKIPDTSHFRVYSSQKIPEVNNSSATDGALNPGDNIYYSMFKFLNFLQLDFIKITQPPALVAKPSVPCSLNPSQPYACQKALTEKHHQQVRLVL